MDKEKTLAISNAIEAMLNVPYDVTEAKRAKEIQEQAATIRNIERPEGRYTIGDAVILLLAETGDYYRLGKAVESGDIPCYKHETGDKKGDPQDQRSYVCWDDLNKWIQEKTKIRKFRFPNPNAPAAMVETLPDTSPSGDDVEEQAPAADDYDYDHEETLAALFDPMPVEALAKMFMTDLAQWKKWQEKAKANGLIDARISRGMFNPYKAGVWFVRKGAEGWDDARLRRVLVNNLPARFRDEAHLLTGGID